MKVKLDDLPVLPFEKILGYLSLEERIRLRRVSRRWHKTIDSFRLRILCCSSVQAGFIMEKSRWLSGRFAQNFIHSLRIDSFFRTLDQSILAGLKHLRLCDFNDKTGLAFGLLHQLEELDLIRYNYLVPDGYLKLHLPTLKAIQLHDIFGLKTLYFGAPKLQKIKLFNWSAGIRLHVLNGGSVEWLSTDLIEENQIKEFKNLKYLYIDDVCVDSTLLADLDQLKEIHLAYWLSVKGFLEQKQQYDRTDLKIFYSGCLLNGPQDPAIDLLSRGFNEEVCVFLAENQFRLANELPFCESLTYKSIKAVVPELRAGFLKRLVNLSSINVHEPIQDIQQFLDFLKASPEIESLNFQYFLLNLLDLLDRLPEYCAVQTLVIGFEMVDYQFLFKLKNLVKLYLYRSIEIEFVRKLFEELEFLSSFRFTYRNREFRIQVDKLSKQFGVSRQLSLTQIKVADPNAAIQFVIEDGN